MAPSRRDWPLFAYNRRCRVVSVRPEFLLRSQNFRSQSSPNIHFAFKKKDATCLPTRRVLRPVVLSSAGLVATSQENCRKNSNAGAGNVCDQNWCNRCDSGAMIEAKARSWRWRILHFPQPGEFGGIQNFPVQHHERELPEIGDVGQRIGI